MTIRDLINTRLKNQLISNPLTSKPDRVVSSMCAVQAQDYYGSLWAIGLRLKNSSESIIEKAVADRTIVRTWPMRGTLHFISSEDIRWMLQLLTPRIISGSKGRYKQLELDDKIFKRSRELFIKNLRGGKQFTRNEMYNLLESNKISAEGQRGIHILGRLAMEGVICFGIRQGKQQTFVLLDEWIPKSKNLSREQSIAELTMRYFKNHSPATLQDFTWWSGLSVSDAKNGLEMVKSEFKQDSCNGRTFLFTHKNKSEKDSTFGTILLPAFDEYLVGYKVRSDVLDPKHKNNANAGGMLSPTIIIDGQVAGTWRKSIKNDRVIVELSQFKILSKTLFEEVVKAVEQYGRFINKKVTVKMRK